MSPVLFLVGEEPYLYEPGDDLVGHVRFDRLERAEAVQLLATGVAVGRRPEPQRGRSSRPPGDA